MKLTILGSGTSAPRPDRGSPGYLLQTTGPTIMLDLGPGALRQLVTAGVKHEQVDAVAITHYHADHSADLIHFLFAAKYYRGYKRQKPVTVIGPEGLIDFHKGLQAAFGPWVVPEPGTFEWRELPKNGPGHTSLGNLTIKSAPMDHYGNAAIAFRFEQGGKAFVYSGDTDVTDELVELAKGADLLLCEAANPEDDKDDGHLTPSEAATMAARAGVKSLILTHFYPECDCHNALAVAQKHFDGQVHAATDLAVFDI